MQEKRLFYFPLTGIPSAVEGAERQLTHTADGTRLFCELASKKRAPMAPTSLSIFIKVPHR